MDDSRELSDPLQERSCRFAAGFHASISSTPGRTVVRGHGEIDIATGDAFRAALIAGLDREPPLLVVDLDGVSFLDACGLGVLVGAANRATRVGIQIMVIGARPNTYRLFDLTRLVDRLDVHRARTASDVVPAQSRPVAATGPAVLSPLPDRGQAVRARAVVDRLGGRAHDAMTG
jgi:anti-anti-sigma factor